MPRIDGFYLIDDEVYRCVGIGTHAVTFEKVDSKDIPAELIIDRIVQPEKRDPFLRLELNYGVRGPIYRQHGFQLGTCDDWKTYGKAPSLTAAILIALGKWLDKRFGHSCELYEETFNKIHTIPITLTYTGDHVSGTKRNCFFENGQGYCATHRCRDRFCDMHPDNYVSK